MSLLLFFHILLLLASRNLHDVFPSWRLASGPRHPALQVVEGPSPLALPGRAAQSPCIERNRPPPRCSLVFLSKIDKVSRGDTQWRSAGFFEGLAGLWMVAGR